MADIKMVVGLGNPGKKYVNTRHNAGFRAIDLLAEALQIDVRKKKFAGCFGEGEFAGKKLILLKPQQFMNRSGQCIATAIGFYKLPLNDLLIVSDDMAIETGGIRIRKKGSSGGQKGLEDIIEKLGTNEFGRLRIGIGESDLVPAYDYVLAEPADEEKPLLDAAITQSKDAVLCWLESGIDAAMNKFNTGQLGQ